MRKINRYILEKLKINKDSKLRSDTYDLINKKAMLCIFAHDRIDCNIVEIRDVTDDYIKLVGHNTKYFKNPNYIELPTGYQSAYAKNNSNPEEHVILKKQAISLLEMVIDYGDKRRYCGKNFNLTKREAENMINEFKWEKD